MKIAPKVVRFLFKFLRSIGLWPRQLLLPWFKTSRFDKHRAPQNLKNFVGDFSEVRITTNLPTGIHAEGIQVDFGNDSTPKSSRFPRRHQQVSREIHSPPLFIKSCEISQLLNSLLFSRHFQRFFLACLFVVYIMQSKYRYI